MFVLFVIVFWLSMYSCYYNSIIIVIIVACLLFGKLSMKIANTIAIDSTELNMPLHQHQHQQLWSMEILFIFYLRSALFWSYISVSCNHLLWCRLLGFVSLLLSSSLLTKSGEKNAEKNMEYAAVSALQFQWFLNALDLLMEKKSSLISFFFYVTAFLFSPDCWPSSTIEHQTKKPFTNVHFIALFVSERATIFKLLQW